MKTFLRVGAWYRAESKSLSEDLDITELLENSEIFSNKNIAHTLKEETAFEQKLQPLFDYKSEILLLNKRIDSLSDLISKKFESVKVKTETIENSQPVKKAAQKKK